jgi:gamma-F420-2:alpha-L-glutamate ligase
MRKREQFRKFFPEMNIWILVKKNPPKSYENLRYAEEAKKQLGIRLQFVTEEEMEIIIDETGKKSVFMNGKRTDFPDVLFSRNGASTTYFQLAIIRHFENQGVFVINESKAIESAKDKMFSLQLLSQKNIPIPKTMLGKFPINYQAIEKIFSYPMVMKKLSGSQGKGIFLIKNREKLEEIEDLLSDTEKKFNFIFQEYVRSSHGKDLRVWVLGGRALGAMKRTSSKSFRANFSEGGSAEDFPLTPEIEWLAVEATRILGLEIAGVDLLFGENGFLVCEVNSNPGFEGFESATGINIPSEVFSFLSLRLRGQ